MKQQIEAKDTTQTTQQERHITSGMQCQSNVKVTSNYRLCLCTLP